MTDSSIQLIPDLISLQTNVENISCFSYWDKKENSGFFDNKEDSLFLFKYYLKKEVDLPPQKIIFRFSNFVYDGERWYFKRKIGLFDFSFIIDEKQKAVFANTLCHHLPVKISWIEPIGYILTDFINYQIGKKGMTYHDGAAGRINDKTFLFFGFGKNFKTTIVNMILEEGGYYIGEEFFLLNEDRVFATIPNSHRFDFRESHRKLVKNDLRKRKIDSSQYDVGIFLVYSNKDEVKELNFQQANAYAKIFNQYVVNSFFYGFLKSKDFLENGYLFSEDQLLKNSKAKFFIIYFTEVRNAFKFINEYR